MDYVIQPETLIGWINSDKEVVIIDVRSDLKNPDQKEQKYQQDHIPGAYYLHLEKDLSGEKGKHGGNHPLPDIEILAEKLEGMGISRNVPVVIYDDNNDMFAPRAWWLLQYIGHEETYVLDGGYKGWKSAGGEVTSVIPEQRNAVFIPEVDPAMTVTMNEVKHRGTDAVLLDSRAEERYLGKVEPLYKKAGHIPGAKNYFWKNVLAEDGSWKDSSALKENFKELNEAKEIIVSCGSGISACPNILALKQAGFHNIKLYPGSFSDWISYEDNPVTKGEEQS